MTQQMNDVGTRYEHLREFISDLEDALVTMSDRIEKAKYVPTDDTNKLRNLTITYQVISRYFNSLSGVNETEQEYKLSCLVDKIPDNPDEIEGGRGTPLCK